MFKRWRMSVEAYHRLCASLGVLWQPCHADYNTRLSAAFPRETTDERRIGFTRLLVRALDLSSLSPWLAGPESSQQLKTSGFSRSPGYRLTPPGGISLRDDIDRYFQPYPTDIVEKSAIVADHAVVSLIGKGSLRPVSLTEACLSFEKRASCGSPDFVRATISPVEYFRESREILLDGLLVDHAYAYPGFSACRGQAQADSIFRKERNVFACSRVHNNILKMLYIPMFRRLRKLPAFSAWINRATVDKTVTRLMTLSGAGDCVSIDFKKFDQTIPNAVIDRIFACMKSWFNDAGQGLMDFAQECFKRTGIYLPGVKRGTVEYLHGALRRGGIPSGSVFTNLVGCLVNIWLLVYASDRLGTQVAAVLIQGDDAVARFTTDISVAQLSDVLLAEVGVHLSVEKSLKSRFVVTFLQNYHCVDRCDDGVFVGIRPICRALLGMLSFEHARRSEWLSNPIYDSIRWIQQMDNCSAHPRFREFVSIMRKCDLWFDEAVSRILCNDPVLAGVSRILGSGAYEYKLPVSELYRSPVVRVATEKPSL